MCGDATIIDWCESDVALCHGTLFTEKIFQKIVHTADRMEPGSFFISIARMLVSLVILFFYFYFYCFTFIECCFTFMFIFDYSSFMPYARMLVSLLALGALI